MMMMMMMLQASSESSHVISFLRAARAGSDQQTLECLDAGVDINVTNTVSRVQFAQTFARRTKILFAAAAGSIKCSRKIRLPEQFYWTLKIGANGSDWGHLSCRVYLHFLRQLDPGKLPAHAHGLYDSFCQHLTMVAALIVHTITNLLCAQKHRG